MYSCMLTPSLELISHAFSTIQAYLCLGTDEDVVSSLVELAVSLEASTTRDLEQHR